MTRTSADDELGIGKAFVSRLAGFTLGPLVSLVSPLVLMPVVARVAGPSGWASLGAATAIGSLLATFTLFGWPSAGPARFAELSSTADRRDLYRRSVRSRMLLLVLGSPLAVAVAIALSKSEWRLTSILMTLASAAVGLSPSWYCVALGKPSMLFRFDVLPRLLATLLSFVLVAFLRQVWIYPVLSIVSTAMGLVLLDRQQFHGERSMTHRGALASTLRLQWPVASASMVSSFYVATPVPLAVMVASTHDAASFSSGMRIYAYASFAILSLSNSLQSWVLSTKASLRAHRAMVALRLHALLALLGFLAIALFGPLASRILFGEAVQADELTCLGLGLAFACVALSTPLLRNVLIPGNRARIGLMGNAVGAVVGVPTMLALGQFLNVGGIAIGLFASEIAVAVIVALGSRRILTYWRNESPGNAS
ncbi:lipopolysaccharide biosynthesis protein [Terrabacter sp. BE26]|uniref:lipopolysaccharide biosynthesis protein n=1 Tax=Terrabacter sp. BE26 TaxID=2898152 RepID=UPI0035BE3620